MNIRVPSHVPAAALVALSSVVAAYADPGALPTPARGGDTALGEISPAGDVDEFAVPLFPGDTLVVKLKNQGIVRGLTPTVTIRTPAGASPSVTKGNGTQKPVLTFRADESGTHVVRVVGAPGEFTGSVGGYSAQFTVRRARVKKGGPYSFAEGGDISYVFPATAGASIRLTARTRKGGFDLGDLLGPGGAPEAGFPAAVKAAKNRRSATVKKYVVTGGSGEYELTGTYDAGSSVTVTATVTHLQSPRKRYLSGEPRFDPLYFPFPDLGIEGTPIFVPGVDFSYVNVPDAEGPDLFPRFWVGDIEIPRASITRPNGSIFTFPAPPGLEARLRYSITVENLDGQRVRLDDAFEVIPPPTPTGISAIDGGPVLAGPAGGRQLRISGTEIRSGTLVLFDGAPRQGIIVPPTRIDVVAPPHAPGTVVVSIRDQLGQTVVVPGGLTYVDVPSNTIQSIDRTFLQSLGGELVTVSGAGFSGDDGATQGRSVLELDGADVGAAWAAADTLTFTAPQHEAGTFTLRVTDALEQTSAITAEYRGFTDSSALLVPSPVTTANLADGFRATRILKGHLNTDGREDLVLLQFASALGNSAQRSRVRVLVANANGSFNDVTATAMPAVSGDEDWRARDGVLDDFDGDGKLDLAIVTDDAVSGGSRSSLRVLQGSGTGSFTDKTTSWLPVPTSWGDRNQGSALVSLRLDANASPDLVVGHTAYFTEVIETEIPGTGDPDARPPIPPDVETEYFHYPATRAFVNDGSGTFTRSYGSMPAVDPDAEQQYQADALAAADYDKDGKTDLFLTRAQVTTHAGTPYRTMRLLRNTGGSFTDVSAGALPAISDPEYLQATRLLAVDLGGNGYPGIVLVSNDRLVSPATGLQTSALCLRLISNNSGTLALAGAGTFPAVNGLDHLQAEDVAAGDLDGDGKSDLVLLSRNAPNFGTRACRILRGSGSSFLDATLAMPSPLTDDDGRGEAVVITDLAGDGDLDVVLGRNEADETVKNLRVFINPRQ